MKVTFCYKIIIIRNMEYLLKKYLRNKTKRKAFLVFPIVIIASFQVIHLKRSNNKSDFPFTTNMDVVYTWVNGSDEKFIESINKYTDKFDPARYDNKDELKYSIRSLEKFAPWIRHVYIVTNGQIPTWLNLEYEKVTVVPHNQLVQEPGVLPTFSSPAIETFIHRIPNLSKRFMYLNDDIFLGTELHPEDMYTPSGGFQFVTTRMTPDCAPFCPWSFLNDEICQRQCQVPECGFDANDCVEGNKIRGTLYRNVYDPFIVSYINSSKLFNLAYGLKRRDALPHIGFLFDKDIIEEMFLKFHREFNNTKYNKFRNINDIQVAYSFVHYVMSETQSVSAEEVFDSFDLDKSETWSDNEIDLLLEDLVLEPSNKTSADYFKKLISNCFKNSSDSMDAEYAGSPLSEYSNTLNVTKSLVTKCSPLSEILVKGFSYQSKYEFQHTKRPQSVSRFILLSSNITEVTVSLNRMLKEPRKFHCIGDLSHNKDNTEEKRQVIKKALEEFYQKIFPYRSKYELPEFVVNQFRYYDDYLEWKTIQLYKSIFIGILGTLITFFILKFCLKLKTSRKLL